MYLKIICNDVDSSDQSIYLPSLYIEFTKPFDISTGSSLQDVILPVLYWVGATSGEHSWIYTGVKIFMGIVFVKAMLTALSLVCRYVRKSATFCILNSH